MRQFMKLVESQQDFIAKAVAAVAATCGEDVFVDLRPDEFGIAIEYIEVPEELRGEGLGDKAMRVLTSLADQSQVALVLTAADEDLEDWYWRHGFEGGRHMVREPR